MKTSDLHKDLIVVDGLNVSSWSRQVFEEMNNGGVTAANCTCSVWEDFKATMDNIAQWK
jgi:membrane dipeptidase